LTDTGSALASSSSRALSFDRQTSYLAQGHKIKSHSKKKSGHHVGQFAGQRQCTAHENYCDATHEQQKQYVVVVQLA